MRKIMSHTDTLTAIGSPNRKSVYNWVRKGVFPEPVQVGPNKIGWYEDEVAAWLDSRPRGFMQVRPELKQCREAQNA